MAFCKNNRPAAAILGFAIFLSASQTIAQDPRGSEVEEQDELVIVWDAPGSLVAVNFLNRARLAATYWVQPDLASQVMTVRVRPLDLQGVLPAIDRLMGASQFQFEVGWMATSGEYYPLDIGHCSTVECVAAIRDLLLDEQIGGQFVEISRFNIAGETISEGWSDFYLSPISSFRPSRRPLDLSALPNSPFSIETSPRPLPRPDLWR